MKVLAVADLHGNEKHLRMIAYHLQNLEIGLLIIAGDIFGRRNAGAVEQLLANLSIPVFLVPGNSDSPKQLKKIEKIPQVTNLHLNPTKFADIDFIGIGGAVPIPFHAKTRFREKSIFQQLTALYQPNSILITHTPPRGSVDRVLSRFHAGSARLAQFVESRQPQLVICGHIHEDSGIVRRGSSCIVNCSLGSRGNGVLIDLEQGGIAKEIKVL